MILFNNVVGRIAVIESLLGTVVIASAEFEDMTVYELEHGLVVLCGGVTLI